jgi:ribose 5-phosphate isomerase A
VTQEQLKRMVSAAAVELIENGMSVGLGTGSTSRMFIEELGARVKAGKLSIRCVASSNATQQLALSLGLDVTTLEELPEIDLYIDGADEIGPGLALIKGGGGALLREKIVASAARRFVVIADSSKVVDQLGKAQLPIEVIKMATPVVKQKLQALSLRATLRERTDQQPYLTDENNYILDCVCGEIDVPVSLASSIRSIVGVVEHGLFLNMASMALVAREDGVFQIKI